MPKKHLYTVPNLEAAHRLGQIAQEAIEAARRRAPDQRERAGRLFRAIYGPARPPRPLKRDSDAEVAAEEEEE